MTEPTPNLRYPESLRIRLQEASLDQLQLAYHHIQELISEKQDQEQQRLLERKGQRVLADMRALMAKAGVSMDELQSVLPK